MTALHRVWFTLGAVLVRMGGFISELPSPSCAGPRDICVAEKLEQGAEPTGVWWWGRKVINTSTRENACGIRALFPTDSHES